MIAHSIASQSTNPLGGAAALGVPGPGLTSSVAIDQVTFAS